MASLLQISLLIRQPGYERKYLHSTGTTNTRSTVAGFADCDLLHVVEKLRSWRQTRKVLDSEEDDNNSVVELLQALASPVSSVAGAPLRQMTLLEFVRG